jgi:hypothetical protein
MPSVTRGSQPTDPRVQNGAADRGFVTCLGSAGQVRMVTHHPLRHRRKSGVAAPESSSTILNPSMRRPRSTSR